MKYYETLYIVKSEFEDDRLDKIQEEVDEYAKKKGGKIVNSYVWGKRRLAYEVDKERYGTFLLLQYGTENTFIDELNDWFELHKSVLAYMTIRLDEMPEVKEIRSSTSTETKVDSSTETDKSEKIADISV
ncbi:MAG: 30S ribosomal protein S6 [Candidatus Marinimicrobia bacterium]|jgi:small subunit ribosomal protein S6|nr:30S ribosomal protein S6 [Candidatus Neomarinimicrobiota bacterium]MDP7025945.1 30S ribosomal protein S6 [Candidatus Neomarinimicrobiota bacterium]|tara:strand:- start:752 stop:1141 length:390 start_codon:yes stop_codon:yes gene_type:complete